MEDSPKYVTGCRITARPCTQPCGNCAPVAGGLAPARLEQLAALRADVRRKLAAYRERGDGAARVLFQHLDYLRFDFILAEGDELQAAYDTQAAALAAAEAQLLPGSPTERAPTTWAYEQVCAALESHKQRLAAAEARATVAEGRIAWLDSTLKHAGLMLPELSHQQVADKVRMLTRSDLDHEMVCVLGRNRILLLAQALGKAEAKAAGLLTELGDQETEKLALVQELAAFRAEVANDLSFLQDICGAVADSELMDEIAASADRLGLAPLPDLPPPATTAAPAAAVPVGADQAWERWLPAAEPPMGDQTVMVRRGPGMEKQAGYYRKESAVWYSTAGKPLEDVGEWHNLASK